MTISELLSQPGGVAAAIRELPRGPQALLVGKSRVRSGSPKSAEGHWRLSFIKIQ